jgi:2-C-methyl-D-erythritol 4-phosphate cytidylyltransferase
VSLPAGSRPDVGVVMVAAGAGVRAGAGEPKQFRPILGVPMLLRALRPFLAHPAVGRVIVALPPAAVGRPPEWLAPLLGERLRAVAGGATRADSVRAGLAGLGDVPGIVLVHDAARPLVSREIIDAVIALARTGVGAVPAVPIGDTVKQAADGRVLRTVSRDGLWGAQTPQGFPGVMLTAAYAGWTPTDPPPTDDAELCERGGFPVAITPGAADNLKVTTGSDWRVAEALLRERA